MRDENKDLRFHITITDKETGETLHDSDANVIIGAYGDGEETCALANTHCSLKDMSIAVLATNNAIAQLKANHEELRPLVELMTLFKDAEREKQEEE